MYKEGLLKNCELFLYTDNSVADYAYYRGSSSSTLLFLLILRLRKIQIAGDLILRVIHISGRRMIECRVNGLSRGMTNKVVIQGTPMLHYLPIRRSAIERSDGLLPWIKNWWLNEENVIHLPPEGWYSQVFEQGNYLWTPPPAASDAALEQICRNFHLHHCNFHIFCIPRLMTSRWRKKLLKVCDLYVEITFDETVWSRSNFEPLILAIVFPFCRYYP